MKTAEERSEELTTLLADQKKAAEEEKSAADKAAAEKGIVKDAVLPKAEEKVSKVEPNVATLEPLRPNLDDFGVQGTIPNVDPSGTQSAGAQSSGVRTDPPVQPKLDIEQPGDKLPVPDQKIVTDSSEGSQGSKAPATDPQTQGSQSESEVKKTADEQTRHTPEGVVIEKGKSDIQTEAPKVSANTSGNGDSDGSKDRKTETNVFVPQTKEPAIPTPSNPGPPITEHKTESTKSNQPAKFDSKHTEVKGTDVKRTEHKPLETKTPEVKASESVSKDASATPIKLSEHKYPESKQVSSPASSELKPKSTEPKVIEQKTTELKASEANRPETQSGSKSSSDPIKTPPEQQSHKRSAEQPVVQPPKSAQIDSPNRAQAKADKTPSSSVTSSKNETTPAVSVPTKIESKQPTTQANQAKPQQAVIDPKSVDSNASKSISKVDPKAAQNVAQLEKVISQVAVTQTQVREIARQVTNTNVTEIVKVQAKTELVKVVSEAIKKATVEKNPADLIKLVRQVVQEPVVKESIRIVTSSSGNSGNSGDAKQLQALLNKIELTPTNQRQPNIPVKEKIDLKTIEPKRIEDIQGKITTKEAAMQAIVGILVDADKLTSRIVQDVQIETASKISQIQSTVDELIKLRVQQFVSLSVKGHGVDGGTFKTLCQETITELANRYGLNDQQRALLNKILIQISEADFNADKFIEPSKKETGKDQKPVIKEQPLEALKDLSPEQIEKLLQKEIVALEEFLKENEEIKRAKAEQELVKLLAELVDESMSYKIDDDLSIIKVFTITGEVLNPVTKKPIKGAKIYAGIFGSYETDGDGKFKIANVPEDAVFMIGVDHPDYLFIPPYHTGTVDSSIHLSFEGEKGTALF